MKKVISFFLAALLALPMGIVGFAADDKDFEKALVEVKTRITVPEQLTKFNYNISENNGNRTYDFSWTTEDGVAEREGVNVSFANGFISQYSSYKYNDYSQNDKKYPKLSKQDAADKAKEYIRQLNPDKALNIKIGESSDYSRIAYDFSLFRVENNIPYYYGNGNIRLDADTGELKNFYMYNWGYNTAFKEVKTPIGIDAAKKIYEEKIGLKPVYNIFYDDTSKPFAKLCYIIDGEGQMMIDAETGEVFDGQDTGGPIYPMYAKEDSMAKSSMGYGAGQSPILQEQEIEALTKNKEFATKEQAESIARGIKIIGLESSMELTGAYLSENYNNKGEYQWQLNFSEKSADASISVEKQKLMIASGDIMPPRNNISVTLNAKTKELISFYGKGYTGKEEKAKYTFEQSEKIAKDVFKQHFANRLGDFEYEASKIKPANDTLYYTFNFIRKVNGISVLMNNCGITICAIDGSVTNAYSSKQNIDFPSAENIISKQQAINDMFANVKFELAYIPVFEKADESKRTEYYGYTEPKTARLVYKIIDSNVIIDAVKGGLLGYNGKPLKVKSDINYSDISGHYAEEAIKRLAGLNILPNSAQFNPNDEVIQLDCLLFLSSLFNGYSGYGNEINVDDKTAVDNFYAQLKAMKVIKAEEVSPKSAVTKEEAIKFVIRFLGIDEYASLKSIFISPFSDITADTTSYVGHISIAAGMNIIKGNPDGTFAPKENMTRAQIAVIMDNYLNR